MEYRNISIHSNAIHTNMDANILVITQIYTKYKLGKITKSC